MQLNCQIRLFFFLDNGSNLTKLASDRLEEETSF